MKHAAAVLAALFILSPAAARAADTAKFDELERKVDALTSEIEKLKLGAAAAEPAPLESRHGFAPAASKVYHASPDRLSIGGYGEMSYTNASRRKQNADSSGSRSAADFVRAILYAGYKFSDAILFNSELEFEHGTTGNGRGEVSVEQAYLDFKLSEPASLRAGTLIVPVGLVNEIHEPTAFHGVKRPGVETNILPSTWRENGAGVYGRLGPVSYRSYVVTGLQAVSNTGVSGFSGSSGLRGGRSSGAKSFAEDLASVTRVDYEPVAGTVLGGSFYVGQADQDFLAAAVPVTIWETHGRAAWRGAEIKALYAEVRIGNVDALNAAQGITAASGGSVGRRQFGGYVEGAFDVFSKLPDAKGRSLSPFARYERYDTQADTPESWAKSPANSRVEYTAGLTFKPIPQVAVKADHQWLRNQARTGVNQWNLGLAYIF